MAEELTELTEEQIEELAASLTSEDMRDGEEVEQ